MRVFAGLWPSPEVSEHLRSALVSAVGVDPVIAPGRGEDGVRWSAAECWHVTLAFYGDLGDGRVEDLAASLAQVAASADPFALHLTGAGVFAHRTLWTEVGARQDERVRSRPHLTLGRATPGGPDRRRSRARRAAGPDPADLLVHALAVYRGPTWPVDELVLTASRPGEGRAGGPLYEHLGRWPLGGAGAGTAG
jgi:2'-5' RNA ligase